MTLAARVGADWPRVLTPAPGCTLPRAPLERRERVLHLSRRNRWQRQAGLTRALQRIAIVHRIVDLNEIPPCSLEEQLIRDASDIAPTLVWMQIQQDPVYVTAETIRQVRRVCARNVVMINWDGDQHYEPSHAQWSWFIDLGRELDASLVKNTKHPEEYAARGVRHPGYLGQGVDETVLRPTTSGGPSAVPPLVFVAHAHERLPAYEHRIGVARRLKAERGGAFGIYGGGWGEAGLAPIDEAAQASVYTRAAGALSVSIRYDLPRYTSNRLLNILASGGVGLVERFAECEGLGFDDGRNCLVWATWDELQERIEYALHGPSAELAALRVAARELGVEHSWDAYAAKLLTIVDAIREERAALAAAALGKVA